MSDHAVNRAHSADFARAMVPVAIALLGEPNEQLSSKDEMRWGKRGSFSVDVHKGTWCDHENGGQGGGCLDLVMQKKRLEKTDAVQWLHDHRLLPDKASPARRIVKTYDYHDAAGALVFQVVRYEPKDFRQRRPDPAAKDGWTWKTKGVQLPLYRLPEILNAIKGGETIYIAEGEKGVDALVKLGLSATCSPGGAGKWKSHHSACLDNARVVILPDNDGPGRDHALIVQAAVKNYAKSVTVLDLPGMPEKGDVFDWIGNGNGATDLEALRVAAQESAEGDHNDAPQPDGQPAPAALGPDFRAAIDNVVAEFNDSYVLVNEEGRAVILQPGFDPALKRRKYNRLTTRDLQTLYLNRLVKVGQKDNGDAILKTAADVWLRHPDRRQFIKGVEFDPAGKSKPGVLNLWEGFAVKPKPGNWSLMQDHIRTIVCGGNEAHADYFLKWTARMVQFPAKQGETAIVMKGEEGCGKGTVANALLHLTGGHGLQISDPKHLVGNFNAHLASTILLFADEAFFAGDKQHAGVLKALITEPTLSIEAKFANMRNQANYLHIIMASNNDWVVPASVDARRFFVLNVRPDRIKDFAYFKAIRQQMEAGGYEAMLHDLLHMDVTTFDVQDVPTTDGLREQRKLSLPTTEAWWLQCLQRGYVFKSKLGLEDTFSTWMPHVSADLLHEAYLEFAKAKGERRPCDREDLGRFFAKMNTKRVRPRGASIVGEALRDEPNAFGGTTRKAVVIRSNAERVRCYAVGDLPKARAAFEGLTTLRIDWALDDPDEDAGTSPIPSANTDAASDWPPYDE